MMRKTASECLGNMGRGAHAQAPKVAALLNDKTTHVRKAAIVALAQMGEESDNKFNKVVGRLIGNGHGSADRSPMVRAAAMSHLPSMGW